MTNGGIAELLNQFAAGSSASRYAVDRTAPQAPNSSVAPSGGVFTYAMLCEALDKTRNAPPRFHGFGDDPHLYHPNPKAFYHRFCIECLMPRDWLPQGAATAHIENLPRRRPGMDTGRIST